MKKKSILSEAQAITTGARQKDYGHPKDNFQNTADLWNTYLNYRKDENPNNCGITITAQDVGMMNILQKISRESNAHKRDNLVDIAGFASTIQMIEDVS